ncbi:MAG: tRNA lysidine(34) synthetase TilS, partial [Candidatus Gastranaerophilales bacterium]|nr:tRNA lysidine(34) synthetase TilS [Candidatus Gastranaerophilales bacterium]
SEFDYDRCMISDILSFIETTCKLNKPSKFSLSGDKWLYVDSNIIEIISKFDKSEEVISIEKEGCYSFEDRDFYIEKFVGSFKQPENEDSALVNLSGFDNLVIRTRRDGDIIKPLGFKGTMKLKKYLMSKNIPQHERDSLILLCHENEVLWVAGVGLSDKIKTTDKSTHRLCIKYKEEE